MRLVAYALTAAVLLLFAGTANAATLFDPALRFRMLPTEHFTIYFHKGEERLAGRLAVIAEETWRILERPLGVMPPRRTQVVLADQTELANGYATPLPFDTIVIYTVSPSGSEFVFGDWLRLAFTHEFTHIVHLDRSEGWARVVRSVFGRTPFAFPNIFLPTWQIEGLATYEESAITGDGRLHAGDFRAIVGEAARLHELEPLDRVNGGLTDWPGGGAAYAYGLGFHEYLVERFGAERLAVLAGATARRLPYTASRAFQRVYGQSLGSLWRQYEGSLGGGAAASPPETNVNVTRVTRQGFSVSGPRFDRFTCQGCPPEILYSASNPDGFPALYRVALDGSAPRRVTTRYLGSTTASGRGVVYFDQMEVRRNGGVYSDLYALSRADGRVRQLTSEARLLHPDLSPDGETLVCVQNRPGQRDLVLVRLKPDTTEALKPHTTEALKPDATGNAARRKPRPADAIRTLISEPDTQFDLPKWSPDGRTVAVERHRSGAMPEIVLVDVATKSLRVIAADAGTRFVMPAWRPDGGAIVAAVAPGEATFNDATIVTGDLRAYLPAFAPHHVAAVRVAGGASAGDSTVGRTFLLGGTSAGGGVVDFGSRAFSLLRGFANNTFAGSHVALVNAEYRWPVARPQRGAGTWPIFVHSIHGALFTDAGHAWTRTFRADAIKTSAGAQLSADIIAGYFAPFTATVGAAWGHDGSGVTAGRVTAYFRIGKAF
ncbi:MAG: hypothetical protein DMF94_11005 [Acidobacteria bacterium]|nr:MAG: hypothetical protein DMF94_11005 [Acidobacteriota bacterium]